MCQFLMLVRYAFVGISIIRIAQLNIQAVRIFNSRSQQTVILTPSQYLAARYFNSYWRLAASKLFIPKIIVVV